MNWTVIGFPSSGEVESFLGASKMFSSNFCFRHCSCIFYLKQVVDTLNTFRSPMVERV